METSKQEWLIKYILVNGFIFNNPLELQKKISGMTATDIIKAMEKAKNMQDKLQSTTLGRELL
jgi:nickel-dependent lactate racemase